MTEFFYKALALLMILGLIAPFAIMAGWLDHILETYDDIKRLIAWVKRKVNKSSRR